MTTYPVLDDATHDAWIIGEAATAEDAATIYDKKMDEYFPDAADRAALKPPTMFVLRDAASLSKAVAANCPTGAFEPTWATTTQRKPGKAIQRASFALK